MLGLVGCVVVLGLGVGGMWLGMCGGGGDIVWVVGLGGFGGLLGSSGGWLVCRWWEVGNDGCGTICG